MRFALGTRGTFSSKDTIADSQTFYNVILAFLNHPDELENVNELIVWWNKYVMPSGSRPYQANRRIRQVFPHYVAVYRAPTANSALAKLIEARKKRTAMQVIGRNLNGVA